MKPSFLLYLLLAGLLLSGCDQPEEALVICQPEAPEAPTVAAFHRRYAPPVQSVLVNTAQSRNVILLDGSYVFVPAGAFVLPGGTPATGTVELRVQLLTKASAMIRGRLPSMSFYRPLETGGQIRLTARQNGVPLRLRPGHSLAVSIRQPTTGPATGQLLWKGIGVGSGNLTTTWIQDTARVRPDGPPAGPAFLQARVYSDTLGWHQIGRLWTSNPADTTLLRADVGGDAATRVYLLPTQRNGAFLMKWNAQTRLMELYGVPAGSTLNVVTLRTRNNQLELAIEPATVRRGQVFRPAPVPVTLEQADEQINGL